MENIIHVNINPLITGFGNWAVSWHGFFSFIAVLFAVILVGKWAEDYNLDQDTVYHVAVWGIIGGVIGAQIGARIGTTFKAEYLRGVLAVLVLAVCAKIFTDLTLTPNDLFSLS